LGGKKIGRKKKLESQISVDPIVMKTAEEAIQQYCRIHAEFIDENPFWYMSERIGFKAKNYLYDVFKQRNNAQLGHDKIMRILAITGDDALADALHQEIDRNKKLGQK